MRALVRVRALRWLTALTGFLLAILGALVACGPIVTVNPHIVVIVSNTTDAPDDVTVNWAIGGVYVGSTRRTMPPHSDVVIVMGETPPDLVEIQSAALTTAWGPPDWSGGACFHIVFPTGFTWSGAF